MNKGLKTKVIFHGDLVAPRKEPEKEELIYDHVCPECGAQVKINSLWDIDTDVYKFGTLFDYEGTEYRCTCGKCGCRFNNMKVKRRIVDWNAWFILLSLIFFGLFIIFVTVFSKIECNSEIVATIALILAGLASLFFICWLCTIN